MNRFSIAKDRRRGERKRNRARVLQLKVGEGTEGEGWSGLDRWEMRRTEVGWHAGWERQS